jgi:hypothetical protein
LSSRNPDYSKTHIDSWPDPVETILASGFPKRTTQVERLTTGGKWSNSWRFHLNDQWVEPYLDRRVLLMVAMDAVLALINGGPKLP